MRVLLVTEPGIDGVFRYVESLCRHLVSAGDEVHLAYSDRRCGEALRELVEFVRCRGGKTLNLAVSNRPCPGDFRALWRLRRLARSVRPHVIHSHSSKAGALARMLRFTGIRAAQFYHPHAYVGMRPVHGRLDVVYNGVERWLGRGAVTVTSSSGEWAFATGKLRLPAGMIRLVRHGIDLERFRPPAPGEKARLRLKYGLPATPVLGFLGRSSPQKDPLTLYRAFARACASAPDLSLFHVGHGELDGELDRLGAELGISGRIFRRDYLDTPSEFYRAVDGFVLASRYEGFSLAALEALGSGLPMILSEVAGNSDLLELPLSHAWRVSAGDPEGVARAMVEWRERLRDPRQPNHRRISEERFQMASQLDVIRGLYAEQAGRGRPDSALAHEDAGAVGGQRSVG